MKNALRDEGPTLGERRYSEGGHGAKGAVKSCNPVILSFLVPAPRYLDRIIRMDRMTGFQRHTVIALGRLACLFLKGALRDEGSTLGERRYSGGDRRS